MMRRGMIFMIAAVVSVVNAGTKIDLETYAVKIVKHASKKSLQDAIENFKFKYGMGNPPVKVLDKVDFTCKSLGLKLYVKDEYPGYKEKVYKKEIQPNIEALCVEADYGDGKLTKALIMEW
jgi:hypothetical protein